MNQHFLVWYILRRNRLKKRYKKESSLTSKGDSSSIADIAFLLLIFFIVTSSFLLPQGFFLKLPSDTAKPKKIEKKYIIDVYPEEDGYFINKKKYDSISLQELFVSKIKQTPETILVVHIKEQTPYRRFIDTLNVARKSKLKRISLREEKK